MSNPQAGWYPDPAGDATKLRYWDGSQWTNQFTDMPQNNQTTEQVYTATPVQPSEPTVAAQTPGADGPSANPYGTGADSYNPGTSSYTPNPYETNPYGTNPTPYPPQYGQPAAANSSDQTMRLIAFIFCIIGMVAVCWAIIPLAWMIPMTIRAWGIYKGTKPNTTAFAVCTLLFVSLVSGILLLISKKDA